MPDGLVDVVRGRLRLLLAGPRARPVGRCPTGANPSPEDRTGFTSW
jgi:hypothetical protein